MSRLAVIVQVPETTNWILKGDHYECDHSEPTRYGTVSVDWVQNSHLWGHHE